MDIAWGGLGNYRMTGAVDWPWRRIGPLPAASRRRMQTSVRGSAVNSCYLALLIALSRTDSLTIGLEIDQVGVHGHVSLEEWWHVVAARTHSARSIQPWQRYQLMVRGH